MIRKLLLVALCVSGCAAQAPSSPAPPVAQSPAQPKQPPQTQRPLRTNLHVNVTMPKGWTPIDLSKIPQGKFTPTVNEDLGASMLISQGKASEPARAEAEMMAGELTKGGFTCSPLQVNSSLESTGFTVTKGSVRGKIVVRHFGSDPLVRLVVMGNWPDDADAEGIMAVDEVIANAQLKSERR